MGSDSGQQPPPRVGLVLPEGELRKELLKNLESEGLQVHSLSPGDAVEQALLRTDIDVVVLRRSHVTDRVLDLLRRTTEESGTPGVVVVDPDSDDVDRAELVAAGVSRVVDAGEAPQQMAETIEVLGQAEQAGGQDGPESGGADAQPRLADFLSRSPYMRRFLEIVQRVSDADASLLITGETGVGKERLARAIHAESARSAGPFVSVNCGALPESLLESELFGHEKGSFTGAHARRIGLFEQADGGTLFLDEIAEMPAHLQVKLLTALQRREIQRLGGSTMIALDVRVMAATHRDVKQDVATGKFREDLYYRLNVIELEIPALRERAVDIPDLVGGMLGFFSSDGRVSSVSLEAMRLLVSHSWPGNIRELINVVERSVLLAPGSEITSECLPPELRSAAGSLPAEGADRSDASFPDAWLSLPIKEFRKEWAARGERRYLEHHLRETGGHMGQTAERVGLSSRALYNRLQALGIDRRSYG